MPKGTLSPALAAYQFKKKAGVPSAPAAPQGPIAPAGPSLPMPVVSHVARQRRNTMQANAMQNVVSQLTKKHMGKGGK